MDNQVDIQYGYRISYGLAKPDFFFYDRPFETNLSNRVSSSEKSRV